MRIYMDVCCLNRPFDEQSQDRIRIESEAVLAILNRCLYDWELVGSEAINYEISKIPDDERRTGVKVLAAISGHRVTVNESILKRASELENIGLKALDALHLACAEKSSEVMLTTDDEIVKKVMVDDSLIKVRVENPVRWLMEITENES
ncbi:MAG: type II toxin-antitoxin system VapC family toxin [Candidatus Methanoperedens sp.]|nr:type II toxin-antitoxin system VapC family toxin [Candidatus Methanoperedens sp.]